jgi:hypothetical protein
MKHLSKSAKLTFGALTRGLKVGEGRKVDKAGGSFMAVHVDRLSSDTYALAHRYTQCGDSMADPDMEFWVGSDGEVYPCSFQQDSIGLYQRAIEFDALGKPDGVRRKLQRDLATFANTWMRNIKSQQG